MDGFLRTPAAQIDLERLTGSSRFAEPDELMDRLVQSVRELTQMLIAFTILIKGDSALPLRDSIRSFTRDNAEFLRVMLPMVRASLRAIDDRPPLQQVGMKMTEFVNRELDLPTPRQLSKNVSQAPDGQAWSEWAKGIMPIGGGAHFLRDVTEGYLEPACEALRAAGATVTVHSDSGGVFILRITCNARDSN